MHRDYRGVAGLVSAVGTDSKFEDDEMQIFKSLGRTLNWFRVWGLGLLVPWAPPNLH